MFNFQINKRPDFGMVSEKDDRDIEVFKYKRAVKQNLWTEGFGLLRDILLILTAFILFFVFVAQPVVVEGTSMVPELQSGERLLVSKLVYYNFQSFSLGHINRGDIVVFWYPKDPDKSYVKRIIGLPGETVEIEDGKVYIDGKLLDEPYLDKEHNRSLPNDRRRVLEHHYFVMGDNRDNSSDSRYWGLVPEKYVYGKAFFRYWKLSNIGFLKHGDVKLKEVEKDMDKPQNKSPEDAENDPRAALEK